LTVDLDLLLDNGEQLTDDRKIPASKNFDVRLYDDQGNLLRQQKAKGGTVQFDVSSLPKGLYLLHVYDGVNAKPVIQQIVVDR